MSNWKLSEPISDAIKTKFPDIEPVILQLLWNRDLRTKDDIDEFLNPDYSRAHDPWLFRDMAKLMERLRQAQAREETVCVYGDYDTDGVCSAVLLVEVLQTIGLQNVFPYLPHREKEGYGLNRGAIDYIAERGASLIITVDCGSSNVEEVAYIKSKGLDVVILDHHEEPPQLPQGVTAFLNAHLAGETYPFKNLAAGGVAFKVSQALWRTFNLPAQQEKWLLDLVAIATAADMMPLLAENRIFVSFGLKVLNKTKRVGLCSLIRAMGSTGELGVYDIGFKIGPRLNAAGRIDHANTAYELLIEKNEPAADDLAMALNNTNNERQAETERILKQALSQVEPQLSDNLVLVAQGEDWQVGVVGLVSGKITDKFNRPSLVITKSAKGLVGSGRSIPGFNITAALAQRRDYLEQFGGHAGACGFTLKPGAKLSEFQAAMSEIAKDELKDDDLLKTLKIDARLNLDKINWKLVEALAQLEPYGMANPRPKFMSERVGVREAYTIGEDGKHLRLSLEQNGEIFEAVSFGAGEEWAGQLRPGDYVDIAYEIDVNAWQGRRKIQLKVQDIKK